MKKVLIIEDQKEIRLILDEYFRKELKFTHVTFACDGLEGYTEAYLQKFDLICTDHEMPFYKGADLMVALRSKPGLNQHTPLIMISSYVADVAKSLAGLDHTYFVEKPIDFARLSRYVKMALNQQAKKSETISL